MYKKYMNSIVDIIELGIMKLFFMQKKHRGITMNKSNLFYYATSELSQDAFLCWLADCANYESDKDLQETSKQFIKMLIDKYADFIEEESKKKETKIEQELIKIDKINIDDIKNVEVIRQEKNIDVLLKVNNEFIIVIEDKTNTNDHSDQLNRYKKYATETYIDSNEEEEENIENCDNKVKLILIYLKTGNYSAHSSPNSGYVVVNRENLLKVLNTYKGTNNILIDFREHMQKASEHTNIFKNEPVSNWNNAAWQGFYIYLQNKVRKDKGYNWIYVPNKAGGFYAMFGHIIELNGKSLYLQFEQKHLAIKVGVPNKDERKLFRERASSILLSTANDVLKDDASKPVKPNKFGHGHYMTVAIVSNEVFFEGDMLNANSISAQLQKYEKLIDEVAKIL